MSSSRSRSFWKVEASRVIERVILHYDITSEQIETLPIITRSLIKNMCKKFSDLEEVTLLI